MVAKESCETRINIVALLLPPSRMIPALRHQHQQRVWVLSFEETDLARTVSRIGGGGTWYKLPRARLSVMGPECSAMSHMFVLFFIVSDIIM